MQFCKINLEKTNYKTYANARFISNDFKSIAKLNIIYYNYCKHKQFKSVMPIFDIEYKENDIIGYYDQNQLVAFSMIGVYDNENIENYQFAWDYVQPKLRLGINSLKHECAYYKSLGFKHYYLGLYDDYKAQFQGFELLQGCD